MALAVGDALPNFDLPTDGGGRLALADLQGQAFVLYLYPKDETSGCTKEAIAFTENAAAFDEAGVRILGLSKDSPASHDKFKAKHSISFTLLSDEEGSFVEALGAWVEKSMYGKKYMGIDRSTFLVDIDGTVKEIWRKVKVPGHAEKVLGVAKDAISA